LPLEEGTSRDRLNALWTKCDRTWIHVTLIALLTAAVFINCLENSFHTDDMYIVKDNPGIRQVSRPWVHFVDPSTMSVLPNLRGYRPLLPLSLSINYAIAGDSFVGYHIFNLAVQIAAAWLVYLLIRKLLQLAPATRLWPRERRPASGVALCVALLFAVHPVSGFAVNYISGRDQLMCQLFFCWALYRYLQMRERGPAWASIRSQWRDWLVILGLFTLSLVSKLYAALAPLLVLWLELTVFQQKASKSWPWKRAGMWSLPLVALYLFQTRVIGFVAEVENNLAGSGKSIDWSYPLTQARLHLYRYIPNFFWPLPIRQDPYEPYANGLDFYVVSGGLFIIATLVAAWRWRRTQPLISFSIVSYWLLMASTSSLAPLFYVAADYRPYPSSPFFFLPLCMLALLLHSRVRMVLATAAIAWSAFTSVYLNTTWRTEATLWSHSVKHGGGWLAHHNLAMATVDQNERRRLLEKALQLQPIYALASVNLGRTLIALGHVEEGLAHVREGVKRRPSGPHIRYWAAKTFIEQRRTKEGSIEAEIAAKLAPTNPRAVNQAALAWQAVNNHAKALPWLDILATLPDAPRNAMFSRAFSLQQLGRLSEAVPLYKAFLKQNPNHSQAHFNLGYAYVVRKECELAIRQMERVLALDPARAAAHLHIANCSREAGNMPVSQLHQAAWDKSQQSRQH
jgi:thioredoxin-like negative regulator of GroEL